MTVDEPPLPEQPKQWEIKWWWVVLAAGVLWLISGIGLLLYLLGPKEQP